METIMNIIMGMVQWLSGWDGLWAGDWSDFMQMDLIDDFTNTVRDTWEEAGADINGFFIKLCNKHLVNFGMSMANSYTAMARDLGAVFSICVAANMAYKMMTEGEGIKVLKLLRPLAFAYILANWSLICTAVLRPGQSIENRFNSMYVKSAQMVHQNQNKRQQLADSVRNVIITQYETTQMQKEAMNEKDGFDWSLDGLMEKAGELYDMAMAYIKGWGYSVVTWIYWTFESIICSIGRMVFAAMSYIIFMMKALFITVLVIFGPIYMITSILDIWKDSWVTWISRMIHVSLYGAMAYLIMTYSMFIINFAVEADISKLQAIVQNPSTGMAAYLAGGFGTSCMCIVAYMVGTFAFFAVPELATFAFPGSVIHAGSSFISGVGGQTKSYLGRVPGAGKVVQKVL